MAGPAADDREPLLSVVLPTYNERDNLRSLVAAVLTATSGTPIEIIVVDDNSPDGTARLAADLGAADPRVRLIERAGKQGLASAVFAGVERAVGPFVCVMDADLSHDPEEIPGMLAKAEEGYDLVVGSRFVAGSMFLGQPLSRRAISWALNLGARALLRIPTHDVLTGYTLCRREVLATMPTRYSGSGFKWLLEVLATQRPLRVYEWPIVFRDRAAGSSKAGLGQAATFAILCARLALWRLRRMARLA
jgi:dolichol-phosphate mannosyltransferase